MKCVLEQHARLAASIATRRSGRKFGTTKERSRITVKRTLTASLSALLLFASGCSLIAQGLRLDVTNPTAQSMVNTPVSFGVPAPAHWNITSMQYYSFGVVDSANTPVPTQFRVLSRWGGDRDDVTKPIRWVLVSFPATVSPNSTAQYWLRSTPVPGGQLTLSSTSSEVIVQTRPGTQFSIDRLAFRLFRSVLVAGSTIVAAPGGGLELTDPNGTQVPATVTETVVESSGSYRAVVRQRGAIGALRYTCRWTFHSERDDVAVDFALENPASYGYFFSVAPGTSYFDACYLRLPVQAASLITTPSETTQLAGQTWRLDQTFAMNNMTDQAQNFSWTSTLAGTQTGSGGRFCGAVDLSGGAGGVTVSMDRFWQNYPKAYKAQNSELKIGLWPEWGNGPEYRGIYATPTSSDPIDPMAISNYRFEGGRWKSHRMVFDFHQGDRAGAQVAASAERTNQPLMGRADPLWTKRSFATGMIFSERRDWTNAPTLARADRFADITVMDSAADPIPTYGQMGLPGFRNNGATWGGRNFYGWENYGDLPWADGYCSLHYDWPMSMLLNWARGGDYGFFDTGRDMAWIRRDYKQNHSTSTAEFWRGAASYEKGWWAGNYRWGEQSHTWIHGVLLHYVLTGEEASREAAIECAEYQVRNSPRYWSGQWGARIPGWAIECLLDAWNYLGNQAYLTEAQAGIDRFRQIEVQQGSNGYVIDPATAYSSGSTVIPANCAPWMHNIFFNAAARYSACTGDLQFVPFLNRMRDWFTGQVLVPASGTSSALRVPGVHSSWAPGWSGGESLHLVWPMIESLTWSFVLTGDNATYMAAAGLFDVITRFHQAPVASTVNMDAPNTWSAITFHMNQYPGTESKILGNALRWSLALPGTYSWVAGEW